jgi:hypothetical protein
MCREGSRARTKNVVLEDCISS